MNTHEVQEDCPECGKRTLFLFNEPYGQNTWVRCFECGYTLHAFSENINGKISVKVTDDGSEHKFII
jgi:uncharacterized Zn finger protein